MKSILYIILALCFSTHAQSKTTTTSIEKPLKFKIDVKNYQNDSLQIGYYLGDKTFLLSDKLTESNMLLRQPDGSFEINTTDSLEPGLYLLLFKPDNKYIEFIVPENLKNDLYINIDYNNRDKTLSVQGDNNENSRFYELINFLNEKRKIAAKYKENKDSENFNKVNEEVKNYQKNFIKTNSNSLVASIIKFNLPVAIPEFKGTEDEIKTKRYKYYKQHYFDNLDLGKPGMLRTPNLFKSVTNYIDRLIVKHPDSISNAIDLILGKMKPAPETYKYYMIHFLNEYAKSKIIGMDAVYVHMADTYYATGEANWVEENQLKKIIKNANDLKPTLIGQRAPNLKLKTRNGTIFNLHDADSEYLVLIFWRNNSNSQKALKQIQDDFDQLAALNVNVLTVATGVQYGFTEADYPIANFPKEWIHTYIPPKKEAYDKLKNYNIRVTPKIYILDKNKVIISKRLAGEQVLDLMRRVANSN